MNTPIKVFTTQATNANSASITSTSNFLSILIQGGFGGGSVAIQVSADGTTWTTVSTTAVEALVNLQVAAGYQVRLALTGATAATLNAWIGYA